MRDKPVNVALYVDIENFVGYCTKIGLPTDIQPIIEKLIEGGEVVKGGKVIVRRSFGDIHKLSAKKLVNEYDIRKMLQSNLVQHEDVMYQNEYKNSADIRLVIDALEVAHTNTNIDVFAVVAADRDYLPLFAKLSEMGKEIVGIGGNKESTPELYVRACDSFLYFENLCRKSVSVESNVTVDNISDYSSETGIRLLVNAMKTMEAEGFSSSLPAGDVLREIARQNPDFDLSNYGYKSFIELCEAAQKTGMIEMVYVKGCWHFLKFSSTTESSSTIEPPPVVSVAVSSDFAIHPEPTTSEIDMLQEWIEHKLTGNRVNRIKLPSYDERQKIYSSILKCLKKNDGDGITLADLSVRVYNDLPYSEKLSQGACFKILYTLYRAGIFFCSQSLNPMDPIIQRLNMYSDDGKAYEEQFVINMLRLYKRETGQFINSTTWSELFYCSKNKTAQINDLIRQL